MITNYKFRKKFSSKSPFNEYLGQGTMTSFYNSHQSYREPSAPKKTYLYSNRRYQVLTTQTKSKERSSAINTKIKTLIRPSSQGNNRIFESSVYLTDPISNTPFEFEVDWFKAVTEKIHQVGSSNSSIDKFHYSFQTTKEEKGTLRLQNSSLNRKIDIEKFKETENIAAVIIQACWRGFKARKFFKNQKKSNLLQKAEQKARNAIKEYEELKSQIQRLRKKQINNPG